MASDLNITHVAMINDIPFTIGTKAIFTTDYMV